jgi:hypothetical protein
MRAREITMGKDRLARLIVVLKAWTTTVGIFLDDCSIHLDLNGLKDIIKCQPSSEAYGSSVCIANHVR